MPAPKSVEDLYDYLVPNGGYAALEAMTQRGGADLDAISPEALSVPAQMARAMLRTPEGAAFMAWMKRQFVEAPSYATLDELGRRLSLEEIAAEGLYRDGQKHAVNFVFQLAQWADDQEETARDET